MIAISWGKQMAGISKKMGAVTLIVTATCALAALPARADYSTTVNPATNWGTWQGWGSSLAWWANVFGTNANMADVLYTRNNPISFSSNQGTYSLPGLGLNVVRNKVGGTSTTPITVGGNT